MNAKRLSVVAVVVLIATTVLFLQFQKGKNNTSKASYQPLSEDYFLEISNTINDNRNNSSSSSFSLPPSSSKTSNKTEKVLVSIVVPTYNSEKFIRTALDSLLNQTLREIEVIVVDSSDKDNSIDVINEYMLKDSRIRAFHSSQNVGPGPSRNKGIEEARGEYVGFVDSDDFVNREFYETLYRAATENENNRYDIAKGKHLNYENGTVRYQGTACGTVLASSGRKICEHFTFGHFTGIFSTKLLREHPDARYGDTLVGEDLVFLNAVGYYARNVVYKDSAHYYYVYRTNSISTGSSIRKFTDVPRFYRAMIDFLKKTGDSGVLRRRANKWKKIVDNELRQNRKYENSKSKLLKNAYAELEAIRQELNEY